MKKDGYPGTRITDDSYSRDLTRALINAILRTGNVEIIFFNDGDLAKEFSGRVTIQPDDEGVTTHDNHLHVRYRK